FLSAFGINQVRKLGSLSRDNDLLLQSRAVTKCDGIDRVHPGDGAASVPILVRRGEPAVRECSEEQQYKAKNLLAMRCHECQSAGIFLSPNMRDGLVLVKQN